MASDKAKAPYLVPAVVKAVKLLEILRDHEADLSELELSKLAGQNASTVHKLMLTLAHCGLVERDEKSKRYTLSIGLAGFGRAALHQLDLRKIAKPILKELSEKSGETAVLGLLRNGHLVLADKLEPLIEVRVSPFIGMPIPMTATSHGKAILACMEADEVEKILNAEGLKAYTPNSIVDPDAFKKEIGEGRARGYAVDREEYRSGVSGVAAPVFAPSGKPVGTLSIVGPAFRVSDKLDFFGTLCREAAERLGSRLVAGG